MDVDTWLLKTDTFFQQNEWFLISPSYKIGMVYRLAGAAEEWGFGGQFLGAAPEGRHLLRPATQGHGGAPWGDDLGPNPGESGGFLVGFVWICMDLW